MGGRRGQAWAAAAGVGVGAVVNVATGMLTQRWGLAWLAASVAFVVVGGGLLGWLTYRATPEPEPARPVGRVVASGDGAISAGGSVTGSSTRVTHPPSDSPQAAPRPGPGVYASGPGAIAAGGDVADSRTEVTRDDPAAP
ncbi:hypothetical protein [Actinomadura rayongensis]|uniref:Uncharacterized protein n=1 Tax=Actinomadura rayongensis TaxID=1429076 RepID=A0A6I4W0W8_9ACTN|nr:hypothetical protein [Actinomadura rayongensis]MXQ63091.1 hypothetical protein [Actinomadura rayongensis]